MSFISFQVPKDLARKLRIRAAERGISRSEAMRQAAELWLQEQIPICPQCDALMFADVSQPGVWFCVREGCGGRRFINPDNSNE